MVSPPSVVGMEKKNMQSSHKLARDTYRIGVGPLCVLIDSDLISRQTLAFRNKACLKLNGRIYFRRLHRSLASLQKIQTMMILLTW